ncbi:MAG: class I SAM-dependent methyltransferase [Rhodospirillaceae bacterium]
MSETVKSGTQVDEGGYITDVPYVIHYYRELNPQILKLALAMNGIAWDRDQNCDYIELGCGFGLTPMFLAAGHPGVRVVGTDFNPEHIVTARGIAASAKLENISFVEGAFADLETQVPGSFDVIAMHGIWSWIDDENRAHILRFIDRHLKPGGLVYTSYNTQPGHAAGMPLRQLMLMGYEDAAGPTEVRVDAGVKFAEKLQAVNAAYFTQNARAGQVLDHIKPKPRNGLAHEYFNVHWRAFYHAEVAAPLAKLGLTYAASAHLLDNVDFVNYSMAGREFLAAQRPDRRESLKDFLANREFRRDIFIRGTPPKQSPAPLLAATRFATAEGPQDLDKIAGITALGRISVKAEHAGPVLTALEDRALTINELVGHPACAALTPAEVMESTILMTALGRADPALPDDDYGPRKAAADRLNHALWEAARTVDVIHSAASPVTGGGIALHRIEQLFLLANERGEDPGAFLRRLFGAQLQGDVAGNYKQFMEKRVPILRKLGVG